MKLWGEGPGKSRLHDNYGILRIDEDKIVGKSDDLALSSCFDRNHPEDCGFAVEVVLFLRLDLGAEFKPCLFKSADSYREGPLKVCFPTFENWELVDGKGTRPSRGIVL